MQIFKFRRSCELSFLFRPRHQSAPESLLRGFFLPCSMIGLFYKFQSGFPPGDCTVMQLVYIVHKIYEAIEEGSEMRAVSLIYQKLSIEFSIAVC